MANCTAPAQGYPETVPSTTQIPAWALTVNAVRLPLPPSGLPALTLMRRQTPRTIRSPHRRLRVRNLPALRSIGANASAQKALRRYPRARLLPQLLALSLSRAPLLRTPRPRPLLRAPRPRPLPQAYPPYLQLPVCVLLGLGDPDSVPSAPGHHSRRRHRRRRGRRRLCAGAARRPTLLAAPAPARARRSR
jgi:hypothetical protein